jgi:two-component system osmolarity sensor histidine kinase EnvZ
VSAAEPETLWRPRAWWRQISRRVANRMPKGLYARSLLIVILPMVILQSVVTYTFMERHWQLVTVRLSSAVVQDIAAMIDLWVADPTDARMERLARVASERLGMEIEIMRGAQLPPALPKPFFSVLDSALSRELSTQIVRPFWIDTVGRSNLVEIRILLDGAVLRVLANRNAAYASNSHIFLVWMIGASLVLLGVAVAFLRNQIRPILRLARAAEEFGKGRDVEFRPHGAREVRQAAYAFLEMRRRIERSIEQRTAMLNGVSHDLRTILTRFKLSLALLGDGPEIDAMQRDVEEMQRMLESYLAFARGDTVESATATDIRTMLDELRADAARHGQHMDIMTSGDLMVTVRPDSFKRLLSNLVSNAHRHGEQVSVKAVREQRWLTIHIDDDGPGIPPDRREDVFRPFYRLDEARNQDEGGAGLGLAIARDLARAHGGDVDLAESPLGGLRATVRVPV